MPIKVLHVTNAFPCDGTPEYGIFIKEQIESLPKERIQSEVFFINGRELGKRAYLKAILEVRARAYSADVIHCHHVYSFLVVLLAGVTLHKPVVLSFLNDWTQEVKDLKVEWVKKALCHLCVRLATTTIFKSPIPHELRLSKKVMNLPNGVDEEFFQVRDKFHARRQLGLSVDSKYLLFVSSKNKFRDQKRYDIFQKVIEIVRKKRPDLTVNEFAMVGQPRPLVPIILSACDVHVLTSDYEGSPNSVKESLACGTPVVSRAVGNVLDMLADVTGAHVVESDDPAELAMAVIRALSTNLDPTEVRASFLSKGLTKRLIAERLVQIYKDASEARK